MSAAAIATRRCCVCGKNFEPRSHNQECCSPPPGKRRSQCSARLNNHRHRGTALTADLPTPFDCEQCGMRCTPGEDVAPHASRFCGKPCKALWHKRREEQVAADARMLDELPVCNPRTVADYKRALRCDPCAYCGAPSNALDHIVPRSAGGPDDWTNRAGACTSCNSSKQSSPLLTFLAWKQARDAFEPWRQIVAAIHTR